MQQGVQQNSKKNSSYYLMLSVVDALFGFKIANCKIIFECKMKRGWRSSGTAAERIVT